MRSCGRYVGWLSGSRWRGAPWPPVTAAVRQVETALAALRQQLAGEPAGLEGIGARCAGVLAAAWQLEHAAAADLGAAGRSWAVVGRALGMTKQSAHERFGKPSGPVRHPHAGRLRTLIVIVRALNS